MPLENSEKCRRKARWCLPQATMSSKSSQEAIVAQVTNSKTSWSGYTMRQGSRSSLSSEKCRKSRARRARGTSSSKILSMMALQRIRSAHGITPPRQHKTILGRPLTWLLSRAFTLDVHACEVADAFEVPLAFLMDSGNHQKHS